MNLFKIFNAKPSAGAGENFKGVDRQTRGHVESPSQPLSDEALRELGAPDPNKSFWAQRRDFFLKQRAELEKKFIPPWRGIDAPMGGAPFMRRLLILRAPGVAIVTADEMTLLLDVRRRYRKAHNELANGFSVKKQFDADVKERTEAIQRGDDAGQVADLVFTRSEYEERAELRRKLLKRGIRLIASEGVPTVIAVLARIQKIAVEAARDWEPDERIEAEAFGLPFRPSLRLVCADRMAWQIGRDIEALEKAKNGDGAFNAEPIQLLVDRGIIIETKD